MLVEDKWLWVFDLSWLQSWLPMEFGWKMRDILGFALTKSINPL